MLLSFLRETGDGTSGKTCACLMLVGRSDAGRDLSRCGRKKVKRDSRKASKTRRAIRRRKPADGRVSTPDVSLPVVPLDGTDAPESNEPDSGEVMGAGTGRLTPSARLAILEGIAADPDAKPGERIKAIEMLDARDSGAGMRQSRSLFSVAREPILTADPDTALQVADPGTPEQTYPELTLPQSTRYARCGTWDLAYIIIPIGS